MKFTAFSCVYNEEDYIEYWLDQVYPHVNEIVLVEGSFAPHTKERREPHARGMTKTNKRSDDSTLDKILKYYDPDKKIRILNSQGDQIDCMNLGLNAATGDYVFMIDVDEFYLDLGEIKNFISKYKNIDAFMTDFKEFYFDKRFYMMNPDKVLMCIKKFPGVKFTKSRTVNARTTQNIVQNCFHYSYLKTAKRLYQKMIPYGSKGMTWYKNVYQNYSGPESLEKIYKLNNGSIHLLFPNKKLIRYDDDHPYVLNSHSLFSDNLENEEEDNDDVALSIIIPSYNRIKYLKNTIEFIKKFTKTNYEIVIVDDNSPNEGVIRYLRSINSRKIKVYFNENGLGFVRTVNKAINQSTGKYLAILNNDTYVQNNWDTHALDEFKHDPRVGMVGFKLYKENNKIQTCGWRRSSSNDPGFFNEDKDRYSSEVMQDVNVLYAPLGIIKKSVLQEIGGLDLRFNMGWSDVDLGIRLNKAGYVVKYCPFSEVLHLMPEEERAHGFQEDMYIFRKNHHNWRALMDGLSGIIDGEDYDNTPKHEDFVDILIITNNRLKYTKKCFEYLIRNTQYKYYKIHVVDNASTDGTIEYLKGLDFIDSLTINKENVPISEVTDRFWKESTADFVAKVDNDTLVPIRWLTRLMDAYKVIPNCGVLGGFHFQPSDFDYYASNYLLEEHAFAALLRQKFIGGCCYLMSKNVINNVGYQGKKPMLFGWTEYQIKLHEMGYKNGYLYPWVWVDNMDDPRSLNFDKNHDNLRRMQKIFKLRKMDGSPKTVAKWYKDNARELLTQEL